MNTKRINSRQKGAQAEREVAEWLRSQGVEARRGVQFSGGPGSPDVVHGLPGVHLEVKRTEALRLHEALAQAANDAPEGHTPVVLHRKNRGRWVAILDAEDWLRLAKEDANPVRVIRVDLPACPSTNLSGVFVAARMHGTVPCILGAAWVATAESVDLEKLGAARRFFLYERVSEAMRSGPLVDDLSGPVGGEP
jgi:hypothetical protein